MLDTKYKILDTAERLIAAQGFASASLRQIIAEAGVNLDSVHYHFGSKEELLDHVIARKGVPGTRDQVGGPNPQFVKLMARMRGDGLLPAIIAKHFQPTVAHFLKALRRSLPDLPESQLYWRLQFMFGAMSRAVTGPGGFPTQGIQGDTTDFACIIRRLQVFLSAGLKAPATQEVNTPEEVKQ